MMPCAERAALPLARDHAPRGSFRHAAGRESDYGFAPVVSDGDAIHSRAISSRQNGRWFMAARPRMRRTPNEPPDRPAGAGPLCRSARKKYFGDRARGRGQDHGHRRAHRPDCAIAGGAGRRSAPAAGRGHLLGARRAANAAEGARRRSARRRSPRRSSALFSRPFSARSTAIACGCSTASVIISGLPSPVGLLQDDDRILESIFAARARAGDRAGRQSARSFPFLCAGETLRTRARRFLPVTSKWGRSLPFDLQTVTRLSRQ